MIISFFFGKEHVIITWSELHTSPSIGIWYLVTSHGNRRLNPNHPCICMYTLMLEEIPALTVNLASKTLFYLPRVHSISVADIRPFRRLQATTCVDRLSVVVHQQLRSCLLHRPSSVSHDEIEEPAIPTPLRQRPPRCAGRMSSMAAACGGCLCVRCGSRRTRRRACAAVRELGTSPDE